MTPTHRENVPAKTLVPATTATSKGTVQSEPAAGADQSALLLRLLDAMQGIVDLENDRLDRQLEHYKWLEEHDN
jgi:hypothetical protein